MKIASNTKQITGAIDDGEGLSISSKFSSFFGAVDNYERCCSWSRQDPMYFYRH